jgi:Family of unknown function (DUF5695)
MAANRREFLLGAATFTAGTSFPSFALDADNAETAASAQSVNAASPFLLEFDGGALTSLRFAADAFPTNYVATGQKLGHIEIAWRRPNGPWQKFHSAEATSSQDPAGTHQAGDDRGDTLGVGVRLEPQNSVLRWTIALSNHSSDPIEVGDLALPLPMPSSFNGKEPPTASVLKHSFISGHGSFLFWMRSNSVGPYLMMTPEGDTSLEYWDHIPPAKGERPAFRTYIHSVAVAVGEAVQAAGGRWRQPRTSVTLAPAGKVEYAFQLAWALDYAGIRQRLVDAGVIDVEIAPGMTVPADLFSCIAVRSQDPIKGIAAEHPEQTTIESLGEKDGRRLYRVKFNRLGENMLTMTHGEGRTTRLEFFACEPLETLIHKRAAFIAQHQVRDASKWYNGLLTEWNMDSQVQLGPDNYDRIKGWRIYEVTCDDPGLSKPAYLASKNAEYPN